MSQLKLLGCPVYQSVLIPSVLIKAASNSYWVKARVEVHGGVRGREGEPLSSMKLYKEVESAVIVGVCYNSGSSNPQIDLHRHNNGTQSQLES